MNAQLENTAVSTDSYVVLIVDFLQEPHKTHEVVVSRGNPLTVKQLFQSLGLDPEDEIFGVVRKDRENGRCEHLSCEDLDCPVCGPAELHYEQLRCPEL